VLVAVTGYAWADAHGHVPGVLTTEPAAASAAAFIEPPEVRATVPIAAPVTPLSEEAPVPSTAVIQALAQRVRDDSRTGDSTNITVVDVLTGEMLVDVGAGDAQVPASTAKLLVGIAALGALGPDFTTRTVAAWDASSREVTLIAGGDMMLAAGAGHGGQTWHANGWAGLGDLAEQVVTAIGARETGDVTVVVDDSAFPGPGLNPELPDYAPRMGYAAAVSGLAVNVAKIDDEPYAQRHPDPALAAGNDLAEQLRERGIDVSAVTRGTSTSAAAEVGSVESAPLSLVVEHLMHVSDNTIAENIARVLARETGGTPTAAGAPAATIAQLAAMGAPTDGLQLYDGAGFSTRNRIAPIHLTGAILAARADANAGDILDALPIAGAEGTVADRYIETPVAGVMRAKTGSLTGVSALAGTVQTADGRLLAFAILADGMPFGQERPRAAFDEFLVALTQCGCQA
jgi:D-alanyl-D-alanine carboxypeptidase/D-alanyl-D-alanine-endopeptidase (penicillin-binding protein 4)